MTDAETHSKRYKLLYILNIVCRHCSKPTTQVHESSLCDIPKSIVSKSSIKLLKDFHLVNEI